MKPEEIIKNKWYNISNPRSDRNILIAVYIKIKDIIISNSQFDSKTTYKLLGYVFWIYNEDEYNDFEKDSFVYSLLGNLHLADENYVNDLYNQHILQKLL